jgi:type I restriction enzyme, S subunit
MLKRKLKPSVLGDIPIDWEVRTFGDFLTESRTVGSSGLYAKKITIKLYGKGIQAKIEKRSGSEKTQYYKRKKGQFIYSKLDFLNGAFAIIPDSLDGFESTVDLPAFDFTDNVDKKWLLSYVSREWFYESYTNSANGSRKARRVHADEFLTSKVIYPPILEQQRIASILSSLDALIQISSQVLKQLETVKRGLMQQLLSYGVEKNRKKFKMFQGIKIPDNWNGKVLSECAVIQSGIAKGKKYPNKETVEVPYLRVANVQDGYFDLKEIKVITLLESEISRYLVQPGDVLLTEGGDADKLGRGHIWNGEIPLCVHQNHLFCVRTEKSILIPEYFNILISSKYAKHYFLGASKQSTNLASINATQLKAFPCIIPSLEEQQRIVTILSSFDARIRLEQHYKTSLETLKKGLMQQLLSGKLDAREITILEGKT